MSDCIFCNIANKTQSSNMLFEDDSLVVIQDILPKAPIHLLIITKKHIESVNSLEEGDQGLAGKMILLAKQMAKNSNISEKGYKLIFNVGKEGGQVISHLHLHLLGGKQFNE